MTSATITRKFALIPETTDKKVVYSKIKNRLVKFRDLENTYIKVMIDGIRKEQLGIQAFSGTSTAQVKASVYDALGFNEINAIQYKKFDLKERAKRCATLYPYECVRNWIVRNEHLKNLVSELIKAFNADERAILTFLRGVQFSKAHMKNFFNVLQVDAFGNGKYLSYFLISNMIRQIRNLILSETKFDVVMKNRIQELQKSNSLIDRFLDDCLGDFTRKKRGKQVQIKPVDLANYFLDKYFARIKNASTKRVKKSLNASEFKSYKKKRDARLKIEKLGFKTKLEAFSLLDLKKLIFEAFQGVIEDLATSSSVSPARSVFKPSFTSFKVGTPCRDDFIAFFQHALLRKVKERSKELFLTRAMIELLSSELLQIKSDIYHLVKIPEIKSLSIPIIEKAVYRNDYANLKFELSLVKREFFKFKVNDKKKRIRDLINAGATPKMPSVSFKGHKLILNLPFDVKKKVDSNQSQNSINKRIEIGVDLGLKHFAVLSVMDRVNPNQPIEIARYFLGAKSLFDLKFNSSTGKFEFKDRFNRLNTNNRSNIKLKLIVLRSNVKDTQRKLKKYRERLKKRGISNYKDKIKFNKLNRRLKLLWERISNINLEIVHLLNHVILEIARYHGASVIKMENLKWARHSKKKDAGKFLAFWQAHWFYSQVQESVKLQAYLHSISFKLVKAANTSKKCSECGKLLYFDSSGKETRPVRVGKSFYCGNSKAHDSLRPFQLDSDLNASRNIVLSEA